jgi:hypothetical protein
MLVLAIDLQIQFRATRTNFLLFGRSSGLFVPSPPTLKKRGPGFPLQSLAQQFVFLNIVLLDDFNYPKF